MPGCLKRSQIALHLVALKATFCGRDCRTPNILSPFRPSPWGQNKTSASTHHNSRGGGTGRRAGFKIRFPHGSASSILAPGTNNTNGFMPFSVFSNLRNTAQFRSAHRTRIVLASVLRDFSAYFVRSRHSTSSPGELILNDRFSRKRTFKLLENH